MRWFVFIDHPWWHAGESDSPQGVVNTSDGRVVRAFHRFTLVDQSGGGRDLMKGRSRAQGAVKISCARQVRILHFSGLSRKLRHELHLAVVHSCMAWCPCSVARWCSYLSYTRDLLRGVCSLALVLHTIHVL